MKNRRIIDDCLALLTSWTASVNRKRTHLRRLTMTMRFLFLFGRIAASGVAMNKKSKREKKKSRDPVGWTVGRSGFNCRLVLKTFWRI